MKVKRHTVKFYTDSGRYMGWKFLKNCSYLEIRSWVDSGNKIVL
jgi:hypothetical protein